MANYKQGFNYYSVDTDRYQDMKIKRLKKSFGPVGIAIYDYLLCEIYRVKGCFIEWGEDTAFDVADYFGIKESLVQEIVNYCGVVGLFNKELLTGGRVLTSLAIQNRFLDWSKKAKRSSAKIPERLKIVQEESAKLQEESAKLQEVSDKVKESKGKQRKRKVKEKLDLSFLPSEYKNLWIEWLDYKRELKDPYDTQRGMKAAFTHLVNISGEDPAIARQIVDQSIREEWKGLFPLKDKKRNSFKDDKMTEAVNYLDEVMKRNNSISNGT